MWTFRQSAKDICSEGSTSSMANPEIATPSNLMAVPTERLPSIIPFYFPWGTGKDRLHGSATRSLHLETCVFGMSSMSATKPRFRIARGAVGAIETERSIIHS
jgi:hypothetical protein